MTRVGVILPQTEIGADPGVILEYARAVEQLNFSHIGVFEHVVGAQPRPGWDGLYTVDDAFHEPFVLFAFLAGATTSIEFATYVLVLPQRPTALVAKQAAELAILSGNRLRLGVGSGWNEIEY